MSRGGDRGRRGRRVRQVGPVLEGWLGIELKGESLVIDSVSKDGLAGRSGFKPGDKVIQVSGTKVSTPREVLPATREAKIPYTMTVQRRDKQVNLNLDMKCRIICL